MPTGYTAEIADGKRDISFQEFALKCARNFGALIEMRDSSLDAPVPEEFTPSSYYFEKIQELKKELSEIETWDELKSKETQMLEWDKKVSDHAEAEKRMLAQRARYESMIAKVNGWRPPSEEHFGLKHFMLQQLEESIKFDCSTWDPPRSAFLTGLAYKESRKAKILKGLTHYTEESSKDLERVAQRNKWLRALRDSLGLIYMPTKKELEKEIK